MKKTTIQFFMAVFILFAFRAEAQEKKHSFGISYGTHYGNEDIFVGDPYNIWIDQTSSSVIGAFYLRALGQLFEVGAFTDFETGKFDVFGLSEQSASRIGIGTLWIGHYPDKIVQLQLGGYFGYNIAFPEYEDIGSRGGIGYGVIVGPAVEYKDFGVAIHHYAGFSWYPKSNGEPDEFSYANAKFHLKLYYKL